MVLSSSPHDAPSGGVLPDLLRHNLKLVFCGTAPSHTSAEQQAYYAHPGNYFWSILYETRLIPSPLAATQYPQLFEYNIGLTDLNKQQHGVDVELDKSAFDINGLRQKILHYRPQILAFTSKHAGQTFLVNPRADYGQQPEPIGNTVLWILPSTSGSARPHWPRLKQHWFTFAEALRTFPHVG